jgi:hypothetical protein
LNQVKSILKTISNLIFGKNPSSLDIVLGIISSLIIPIFLFGLIIQSKVQWSLFQIIIALEMGFDLGGSMVVNMMRSTKAFYHTQSSNEDPWIANALRKPLLFIGLHIYPILVYGLFEPSKLLYGFIWYGLLLAFAYLILKSPKQTQYPISILCVLIAIMINSFIIIPVYGFEWLIPVLYIKLLVGRLIES